jgi:WD40 repeat protein
LSFDDLFNAWKNPFSLEADSISRSRGTLSPDGRTLVSNNASGKMAFWDVARSHEMPAEESSDFNESKLLLPRDFPRAGPQFAAFVLSTPTFSPDGLIVGRMSSEGFVDFWDVRQRRRIGITVERNLAYSLGLNEKRAVTLTRDGKLRTWDLVSGLERFAFKAFEPARAFGVKYELSDDATKLAIALDQSSGSHLTVFDTQTGQTIIANLATTKNVGLKFAPDGELLALTGRGFVDVIRVSTGQKLYPPFKPDGIIGEVEFAPDSTVLAVANGALRAKNVTLYDIVHGKQLVTLKGHQNFVVRLAFSADGSRIATSTALDRAVRIWDVASGQPLVALATNDLFLQFSSDGRTLITAGPSDLHVWRGATDEEVARQRGH